MDILANKMMSRFSMMSLLVVLLFATSSVTSIAENYKASQKQKVIAGAIYKFIKFIEWEDSTRKTAENFNLCLQRYDPAFDPLTKRKVQGKAIQLRLLDKENFTGHCDVLFLNAEENNGIVLLKEFKNKSVLTISEQVGFATQGGIIELGSHNNRLTFSINLLSAKANNLNIGFQLLSLANHVIKD